MTTIAVNLRNLKIKQYIDQLKQIDINSIINTLPTADLRHLIEKSKAELKEHSNEQQVIQQMIHNQLNITIARLTDETKFFLQSQNVKITTYQTHITEYRKEISKLLNDEYTKLQLQYRIRHRKLQDTIHQQCLTAQELHTAMIDIKKNIQLLDIKFNMDKIQRNNPVSRAAQIALFKMTAGQDVHKQIKNQYEATKRKRQEEYQLIDSQKYIKIAENLLQSQNHHELIAGICALTGRRSVEVVKTGKFELYKDYLMTFTGQVKKRTNETKTYVIPVLCSPTKIIKAHKQLKYLLPAQGIDCGKDSNKSINNRLFTSTNFDLKQKLFEHIYPPEADETSFNLRAIYTTICYNIFEPNMSFLAYTAKILNHKNLDIADAYDQYKTI